jgi:hypothetical protein
MDAIAAIEAMLTMLPPPRAAMREPNERLASHVPVKLTAIVRSHTSSGSASGRSTS